MKTDIENNVNENDTEEHLSSRQSYRARQQHRLAQSFETMTEATERARTTLPKVRESRGLRPAAYRCKILA